MATQPTTHHPAATAAIGGGSNSNVLDGSVVGSGDVETNGGIAADEMVTSSFIKRFSGFLTKAAWDANDGVLSTGSFMMGVGGIQKDRKSMILGGVVSLVSGATTMAITNFSKVKSQYDIELAEMQRQRTSIDLMKQLPNAYAAALASAVAFSVGASVPILGAAFLKDYKLRLGVVVGVVSVALMVFGGLVGALGKAPWVKSSLRGLISGWLGMAATFGLAKLTDHFSIN